MRTRSTLTLSLAWLAIAIWSVAALANNYDGGWQDTTKTMLGVQVHLTTPPVPNLHGGVGSAAWAMAVNCTNNQLTGPMRYAQVGIPCQSDLSTDVRPFAQAMDDTGARDTYFATPVTTGTTHMYKAVWNGSSWSFYVAASPSPFWTYPNCTWHGTEAQFYGETNPDTTVQLMGDSTHPVTFSQLLWRSADISWPAIFPASGHFRDDSSDWAQSINAAAGTFTIYDSTP